MKNRETLCPMNCHPTQCGMLVEKVLQGVIWMRDGWVGVNNLTNAAPSLSPEASDLIDPYMLPGGQAAFDAFVEVRKL